MRTEDNKGIRPAYKPPIFFKALCVFVSLNSLKTFYLF